MESMVKSDEVKKVLVICDRGYKEKADKYSGGVGVETQILTPEIYNNLKQEKIIPIVVERDKSGNTFVPKILESRKYLDLSNPDSYEWGYENLVRNIYNRPLYRKPNLGSMPEWIVNEEPDHQSTRLISKEIELSARRNSDISRKKTFDFFYEFIKSVEKYIIDSIDEDLDLDEIVYNSIVDMKYLRDDYIKFLEYYTLLEDKFDIDSIIEVFEQLEAFSKHRGSGSYYDAQYDNIKFFNWELFIYTIAVFKRYKKYDEIGILLSNNYCTETIYNNEMTKYSIFRNHLISLDTYRKRRLNLNWLSVTAQLMMERCDNSNYTKMIL
jgi:hypothetical protein